MSRCRCAACRQVFDPTVAFKRCSACGGKLRLRVCRYSCRTCGADVPSHFAFDGAVFDREYFRKHMAESRQRKKERREQFQELVAETRSGALVPEAVDLGSVPGLVDALNGLVAGLEIAAWIPSCPGFDLELHEAHVRGHLGESSISFDDLPPLGEDPRLDRIWRFIAVIFLAHSGQIEIRQEGEHIRVSRIAADAEG